VASKPKVGGQKDPDLGKIRALAPDLVVANIEENPRDAVEQLRAGGIPVWVTFPRTVLDAIRLIREIREVEGMYVLISSHLLRDVEETCEEVLILKDGRIAAHADLEAERRSNRRFVELETVGTSRSFTGAVQGLGCECAFYPNGQGVERIKLVLPESIEMRELFRLAAQHDVEIRSMNYRRDSLEDIFLAAMKEPGGARGGV